MNLTLISIISSAVASVSLLLVLVMALMLRRQARQQQQQLTLILEQFSSRQREQLAESLHSSQNKISQFLQQQLLTSLSDVREQISKTLQQQTNTLEQRLNTLTQHTERHLQQISGQVEKRLTEGFEKTTATFTDIIKRLALIDDAQKKMMELSNQVVSLQQILADKRSRGTLGEVQLRALIDNVLPASAYGWQYTLSNGKRADCMLFLPQPTGNIVVDAKFPLENYRMLVEAAQQSLERKNLERQFRQDIKKHIDDIAHKYIISGETADGAVMFIPAEAIFADIHANFPDLLEHAYRSKVWLVSPTTLMAVLTTARAVLKDEATREQVHVIQEHLRMLAKDFTRFEKRMDNLARHIDQANKDVGEVHISAQKITNRFSQIEQVQLHELDSDSKPILQATTLDDTTA